MSEKPFAILAEYKDPGSLLKAAKKVKAAGYSQFDAHSPFPIHGMDQAMQLKPSILGKVAFWLAAFGAVAAMALQVWTSAVDYPIRVSGKPYGSIEAFIPVTFEAAVLLCAFGTVFFMFLINKLPQLYHPLFRSENFRKASSHGFFISIECEDPQFHTEKTESYLKEIGALKCELIKEEEQ